MDNEILEQLKNISAQLEKIAKLMEEKKTFGSDKKFGGPKKFGGFGGDKKPFAKKPFERQDRFNTDGSPRFIADGRDTGRKFGGGFKPKKRRF